MSKITIAIDIDDVLADSTDLLRRFVNERHAVSLQEHHYRVKGPYWGYYEMVWRNHDINGDGIMDEFHKVYAFDQSGVAPINGAAEALARLKGRFRLIAISARAAEQQLATERWLSDKFENVFEAVSCLDVHRNPGLSKGEACRIAGAEYLIDDNIDHCKSALDRQIQGILFGDYGWHDDSLMPDGVVRCRDWYAVLEYFDGQG